MKSIGKAKAEHGIPWKHQHLIPDVPVIIGPLSGSHSKESFDAKTKQIAEEIGLPRMRIVREGTENPGWYSPDGVYDRSEKGGLESADRFRDLVSGGFRNVMQRNADNVLKGGHKYSELDGYDCWVVDIGLKEADAYFGSSRKRVYISKQILEMVSSEEDAVKIIEYIIEHEFLESLRDTSGMDLYPHNNVVKVLSEYYGSKFHSDLIGKINRYKDRGTVDIEKGLCVTGDTVLPIIKVHSPQSIARSHIVDVKPGDYVLSLNEDTQRIEPHRIKGLLDMGTKPVYGLTTASGRSIKTTANHPYLTRNGWIKVNRLREGDEIGVPAPDSLSSVCTITNFNTLNSNIFTADIKRYTIIPDTETMGAWRKIYQWFCTNKGIRQTCIILQFFINAFLDILWQRFNIAFTSWGKLDYIHNGAYTNPSSRSTSSKGINPFFLASDIDFFRERTNLGLRGSNDSILSISQPAGFTDLSWYSSVDILSTRDSSIFESISSRANVSKIKIWGTSLLSTITAALEPLLSLNTETGAILLSGMSFADFNFTGRNFISSPPPIAINCNILISLMSRLLGISDAEASEITEGDILWDKIVLIEYIGYEHVYDIEVEGTHNFIGNGIFAHNTHILCSGLDSGGRWLWLRDLLARYDLPIWLQVPIEQAFIGLGYLLYYSGFHILSVFIIPIFIGLHYIWRKGRVPSTRDILLIGLINLIGFTLAIVSTPILGLVMFVLSSIAHYFYNTLVTQNNLPQGGRAVFKEEEEYADLSAQTIKDLMIFEPGVGLFDSVNETITTWGEERLMWLLTHPYLDEKEILARQEFVCYLMNNPAILMQIREILAVISQQKDINGILRARKYIESLPKGNIYYKYFHAVIQEFMQRPWDRTLQYKVLGLIGELDAFSSLAQSGLRYACSKQNGHITMPRILEQAEPLFQMKQGIMPGKLWQGQVPNDIELSSEKRFAIITGPNSSGKTMLLRTIGRMAILSQIGSSVPAEDMAITPMRIHSLISISDDLPLLT